MVVRLGWVLSNACASVDRSTIDNEKELPPGARESSKLGPVCTGVLRVVGPRGQGPTCPLRPALTPTRRDSRAICTRFAIRDSRVCTRCAVRLCQRRVADRGSLPASQPAGRRSQTRPESASPNYNLDHGTLHGTARQTRRSRPPAQARALSSFDSRPLPRGDSPARDSQPAATSSKRERRAPKLSLSFPCSRCRCRCRSAVRFSPSRQYASSTMGQFIRELVRDNHDTLRLPLTVPATATATVTPRYTALVDPTFLLCVPHFVLFQREQIPTPNDTRRKQTRNTHTHTVAYHASSSCSLSSRTWTA